MIIEPANRLKSVEEYYFSKKLQQIREMNLSGADVINLGIGDPDLSPSNEVIAKIIESVQRPQNHGYQSYRGIPDLRKSIAAFYKKTYNVSLDGETEVLPLLGSKEGIMHISMAFLNPGDEVLVPDPGYPTYSSVTKLTGAKVVYYNLDEKKNWSPDYKNLSESVSSLTKIIWINYPNMPTGGKATDDIFKKIIEFAHFHKILICHDNPYSMILNQGGFTSILSFEGAKDVALELNSLSKSHNMPGWRVGWVSGKKEYIDTILKVKSNVDSGMFLPVQHGAIEALNNSVEWHKNRNEEYSLRRKKVWHLLDILNCKYDSNQVGLFVWAKLPDEEKNPEEFVESILQSAKVFITPGFIFGKMGARHVRVSLCNSESKIQEAAQRILSHPRFQNKKTINSREKL